MSKTGVIVNVETERARALRNEAACNTSNGSSLRRLEVSEAFLPP
jgi:hypothetical protein